MRTFLAIDLPKEVTDALVRLQAMLPAGRAVPPAALAAMAPDGRLRTYAMAIRLIARPWQIGPLVMLARDAGRAQSALRRVALLGGPLFGLG